MKQLVRLPNHGPDLPYHTSPPHNFRWNRTHPARPGSAIGWAVERDYVGSNRVSLGNNSAPSLPIHPLRLSYGTSPCWMTTY